ncbi:hypothetical protein SNEBB_000041 [Seison nebaliae]|nr:hypothetical protein SNEBB_000041 [Seison nebaliae]
MNYSSVPSKSNIFHYLWYGTFFFLLILLLISKGTGKLSIKGSSKFSKIGMVILYETLCADSQRFFLNQFPVVFKTFLKSIGSNERRLNIGNDAFDVQFVPFGKSHIIGNDVKCQHGAKECEGNLYHQCLIRRVRYWYRIYPFIQCSFEHMNPSKLIENYDKCLLERFGNDVLNDVRKCMKNDRMKLMEINRKLTMGDDNRLPTNVPAFILNDEQLDDQDNYMMEQEFLHFLCRNYFGELYRILCFHSV